MPCLHAVAVTTAQAACPTLSPSCSNDDDSSAAHPAFMQRRQRQLSRAPCLHAAAATTAQAVRPTPSPSCSGGDDSSGCAPCPISFVQWCPLPHPGRRDRPPALHPPCAQVGLHQGDRSADRL